MPRTKSAGSGEPKKRSRTGCWPCKDRKVKCGEEKPRCQNCIKQGETCDYSIRLNWCGRVKRDGQEATLVFTPTTFSPKPAKSPSVPPLAVTSPLRKEDDHSSQQTSARPDPDHVRSLSDAISETKSSVEKDRRQSYAKWYNNGGSVSSFQFESYSQIGSLQAPSLNRTQSEPQGREALSNSHLHSLQSDARIMPTIPQLRANIPEAPGTKSSPAASPSMHKSDLVWSSTHGKKRIRLSSGVAAGPDRSSFQKPCLPDDTSHVQIGHPDHSFFTSPYSAPSLRSALMTPSSSGSADLSAAKTESRKSSLNVSDSPEYRRLSVNSLLSAPDDNVDGPTSHPSKVTNKFPRKCPDGTIWFGYDYGLPDFDMPRNDDRNAIAPQSSADLLLKRPSITGLSSSSGSTTPDASGTVTRPKDIVFERGGYYASPVLIKVPAAFEPLPPYLIDNPMNLLYFHHFLSHTARILVIHDCLDNPLRTILPQMACKDANLMNLLLAYSASHRARLLNQPEPANRIALWTKDVFPQLRAALSSDEPVPDSQLAIAIMLASLEIVSPNTFAIPITWQNHLRIAREIIVSRGGLETLCRTNNQNLAFLCKWYAYLEVLGSLSGGDKTDPPLSGDYWPTSHLEDESKYQVDCFLGFTTRCVSLLAQVATLSHQCDAERLDSEGNQLASWTGPSKDMYIRAQSLIAALQESRSNVREGCTHSVPSDSITGRTGQDIKEIRGSNDMYHWAGLIHLHCRVLGRSSLDPEIQHYVSQIVSALSTMRKGSSIESCLLFPMFTAGCEATKLEDRDFILERMRDIEGWGMTQFSNARALMQKVWQTGKPWETLIAGEFFG